MNQLNKILRVDSVHTLIIQHYLTRFVFQNNVAHVTGSLRINSCFFFQNRLSTELDLMLDLFYNLDSVLKCYLQEAINLLFLFD